MSLQIHTKPIPNLTFLPPSFPPNPKALIGKLKSLMEVRINSNPFQCTCRWLREAASKIPQNVMITGLASTVCRTDLPKTHAPTVAGFADATCQVKLPGEHIAQRVETV